MCRDEELTPDPLNTYYQLKAVVILRIAFRPFYWYRRYQFVIAPSNVDDASSMLRTGRIILGCWWDGRQKEQISEGEETTYNLGNLLLRELRKLFPNSGRASGKAVVMPI